MSEWYDPDGNPISDREVGPLMRDPERKFVAKTHVHEVEVSTVWLGLDHSFGDGPPLIFETMVFGGPHDQYCERWPTKEAAQAGHDRIVAWLSQEGPWCGERLTGGPGCMRSPGHEGAHLSDDYDKYVEWWPYTGDDQ